MWLAFTEVANVGFTSGPMYFTNSRIQIILPSTFIRQPICAIHHTIPFFHLPNPIPLIKTLNFLKGCVLEFPLEFLFRTEEGLYASHVFKFRNLGIWKFGKLQSYKVWKFNNFSKYSTSQIILIISDYKFLQFPLLNYNIIKRAQFRTTFTSFILARCIFLDLKR